MCAQLRAQLSAKQATLQDLGVPVPNLGGAIPGQPFDEEQAVLAQLISFLRSPVPDELRAMLKTYKNKKNY